MTTVPRWTERPGEPEIALTGGDVTEGLVRAGDTVRRTLGRNAPYVHALLEYLGELDRDAGEQAVESAYESDERCGDHADELSVEDFARGEAGDAGDLLGGQGAAVTTESGALKAYADTLS